MKFRNIVVYIFAASMALACFVSVALGVMWLYVFLLTDYRSHLWKWGVAAGAIALIAGGGGILAIFRVFYASGKEKHLD